MVNTGGGILQKLSVLFVVLIILLLVSCEQEEVVKEEKEINTEDIKYSFKHPETGQEYNVVHAYKLYNNYVKKIKDNPSNPKEQVFEEEVIKPIFDSCYKDAEFFERIGKIYSVQAPSEEDLNEIKATMEKIDEDKLNDTVVDALIEASNYIPSEMETNVCIYPSKVSPNSPLMMTEGSGKISAFYNKFYEETVFKAGLAHEYHHSVWTERYYDSEGLETVLDHLILEGKAVMFEKLVYPDVTATIVNYNYNKDYWEQIEPYLYEADINRAYEITLGGNGLPNSYGYSEGYKMLKSYLDKHPGLSVEEWTSISGKVIYEEGRYMDYYQ